MTPRSEFTLHLRTTPSAATEDDLEVIRAYLDGRVYGPVVSLNVADGTVELTCQVPGTDALAAASLGWQYLTDAYAAAQVTTKGVHPVAAEVARYVPAAVPAQ